MSFECDCCGKNSVDRPGDWCYECQEREFNKAIEDAGIWYNSSALCLICRNADGPEPSDKCNHYKMPLSMCKRKFKCKHFLEDDGRYDYEDDY